MGEVRKAIDLLKVPDNYEDWKSRILVFDERCKAVQVSLYEESLVLSQEFSDATTRHLIGKRVRYHIPGTNMGSLVGVGEVIGSLYTRSSYYDDPPLEGIWLLVRPDTPGVATTTLRHHESLGPVDVVTSKDEMLVLSE